jgi:hypothetical protein
MTRSPEFDTRTASAAGSRPGGVGAAPAVAPPSPGSRVPLIGMGSGVLVLLLVLGWLTVFPHRADEPVPAATPASSTAASLAPPHRTSNCALAPHECGYPDAETAGVPAGTTLRKVPQEINSGPGWTWDSRGVLSVIEDGAVLDGLDVQGNVDVKASNVTIRNSRIQESGESFGVSLRHTKDVTVQNCEIYSPDAGAERLTVGIKDIYGDSTGMRLIGNDIWHTGTGIQVARGLIQDNYIHDMGYKSGDHLNGITDNGGSTEQLTVRHNTVFNQYGQTDAISLFQDFGRQDNRVIDDNLVAGGGYTIYGGANAGAPGTTNIRITNNRFARIYSPNGGGYGPLGAWDPDGKGNAFTGNVWDDTGKAVQY